MMKGIKDFYIERRSFICVFVFVLVLVSSFMQSIIDVYVNRANLKQEYCKENIFK